LTSESEQSYSPNRLGEEEMVQTKRSDARRSNFESGSVVLVLLIGGAAIIRGVTAAQSSDYHELKKIARRF
jgi:hypothetical protein